MALYVGLDVSLKTTSIWVVGGDGSTLWERTVESEPTAIVKALIRWRDEIALAGIEACHQVEVAATGVFEKGDAVWR
jgi:transposase